LAYTLTWQVRPTEAGICYGCSKILADLILSKQKLEIWIVNKTA